jgi:tripartite-type tricarboxylate transporter receptor subunit TctC
MNAVRTLALAAAVALAGTGAAHAQAENYPNKVIRFIVPFPAGGGVDFVARAVAQRLSDSFKQQVIVENKGGGSGRIGAESVARSEPDGYTILIGSPAETIVATAAGLKLSYDPRKDLVPVTLIGETPLVIAVHPSVPVNSLSELIAMAKAKPGSIDYGSPGVGSSMQFAGAMLELIGGIQLQHIPYKGAAPAVTDALGGQVPVIIVGSPPVIPHAKAGKLKVLAVTSDKRSPTLPDTPTVAELPGYEKYRFTNWMGVFVAARTPQPIIDRLASEIARISKDQGTREALMTQGVEGMGLSPAEFQAFLDEEFRRYATIAKERNITVE